MKVRTKSCILKGYTLGKCSIDVMTEQTNNNNKTEKLQRNSLYRATCVCTHRRGFEFFCSVNRFNEGGVNVNHNVTCSLTLECSRIAKEMAMVSGFFSREGGRRCFILASDKNKKDQENLRSKFNKNALTAAVSLASLEIRSINEEAINSIRNRIYSLKIFYFLLYRRRYFYLFLKWFSTRVSDNRKYVCSRRL